ncbi:MAG TPA: single-stranded DNA-binding protein [Streptosporangiaceae bacterium]|nr:single-stranded DNA-binding protein [Streptosporangiaceae bacterium]
MFNEANLSLAGFVAGEPSYARVGKSKVPKLTLRVSWTPRRRDSATGEWIDGNRSFINVICWRQLAENGYTCVRRGDAVVVKGRLDVRTYTGRDGQRRTAVDVEASALGPDLNRGVATFRRVWPTSGKTAEELASEAAGHSMQRGEIQRDEIQRDDMQPGDMQPDEMGPDEMEPDEAPPTTDEALLAKMAGAGPATEGGNPEGEDIFDQAAIGALEQEVEESAPAAY